VVAVIVVTALRPWARQRIATTTATITTITTP
jgi:hypothetical protein